MDEARIAIVTGATRGIGFEICRQLGRLGIHVLLTSRDKLKGRAAAQQLQAEGLPVQSHPLDVTDCPSAHGLHQFIEAEYGRLDVLVNNAGILLGRGVSVLEADLDLMRLNLETMALGPMRLCQTFVPMMLHYNYGRIVNMSSGWGQLSDTGTGQPGYRMAKTALNSLTVMLAAELEGTNVLVNSMCPGWVRTEMGGADADRSVEQGADTAVWLATLPEGGPSGGFFEDRQPIPW